MRIIHTADWHLGQTLLGQSRHEEQQLAFDWLYELVLAQQAEALIVAGDIFDVASPAEDARKMYYDFLARLASSSLKWIVVVAGNHDSPRMIAAVQQLAAAFNIYVVGTPTVSVEQPASDLIQLREPSTGELAGVVAAIPFLPERLMRSSKAGEDIAAKEQALAEGIHAHYQQLADACEQYRGQVPIVATGHLYASGAVARDGQDNIYVGKLRNLNASQLPDVFGYVALGHIHRPQTLKGCEHVRYSGSLVALDFAESADTKGCWVVELNAEGIVSAEFEQSPVSRRLKRLTGTYEALLAAIQQFGRKHQADQLSPWLELQLSSGSVSSAQRDELRACAEAHGARVLKVVRQPTTSTRTTPPEELPTLAEVDVEHVFDLCCAERELSPEERAKVQELFEQVVQDVKTGHVLNV